MCVCLWASERESAKARESESPSARVWERRWRIMEEIGSEQRRKGEKASEDEAEGLGVLGGDEEIT